MMLSLENSLSGAMGIDSFAINCLSFGPTLVCPLMLIWREYKAFCEEWGFYQGSTEEFVTWLENQDGVTITEHGRGRRRRCANGVGVLPHGI